MELSEQMKQEPPSGTKKRGPGRHAFLALKKDIHQAMNDGYTAKDVWEFLHERGRMPIKYRTFIDYVNRYLQESDEASVSNSQAQQVSATPAISSPAKAAHEPIKKKEDLTRRFSYDAKGKSADELI